MIRIKELRWNKKYSFNVGDKVRLKDTSKEFVEWVYPKIDEELTENYYDNELTHWFNQKLINKDSDDCDRLIKIVERVNSTTGFVHFEGGGSIEGEFLEVVG